MLIIAPTALKTVAFVRFASSKNRDAENFGKRDRKSTRLNSSHMSISYAVFCLKKKRVGVGPVAAVRVVGLRSSSRVCDLGHAGTMCARCVWTVGIHDPFTSYVRQRGLRFLVSG